MKGLFGVVVAGLAVQLGAQTPNPFALNALTVPASALPNGCALAPSSDPDPRPVPTAQDGVTPIRVAGRFGFPTNPWSGTDRKSIAAIHAAIDPAPGKPLPDVPPTARRDAARAEATRAASIVEAYHAAYGPTEGRVEVNALTFNDQKLTVAPASFSDLLNPSRRVSTRVVRGATVIRVSAPGTSACFDAVRAHIESLK